MILPAEDHNQFINRNRRWNFVVNVSDLSCFHLSLSFIFATTILPLYTSYLTSTAVLIGLIPAIMEVAAYLPQLLVARRIEQLSRMKPFIVKISIFERLPYLFVALGIFLWPQAPPLFAYLLLAFSLATARVSGGIGTPAWLAMLAKVIHPDRKGLLFGLGYAIGGMLGIGGAWIVRSVMARYSYPLSFGFCFFLSFSAQALSWFFLSLNREPAVATAAKGPGFRDYLKQLPAILRRHPDFRMHLLSQALIILGGLGISFYIVYARQAFQISNTLVGTITIVALLSQSTGTPVLGWLADRLGHKWVNQLGALLGLTAAMMMLFLPNPNWLFPVFVVMNLSQVGLKLSRMSIHMEFGGQKKLPTFVALANTLLSVPVLLSPVIGGWIIDLFSYRWAFSAAAFFYLAGWLLMTLRVSDPRVKR